MHVVPSKVSSMDKFAAERIVEDIVYLGHTRVILRSDNEPALLLLFHDALKGLRVQKLDSAAAEVHFRMIHRQLEQQTCQVAISNAR